MRKIVILEKNKELHCYSVSSDCNYETTTTVDLVAEEIRGDADKYLAWARDAQNHESWGGCPLYWYKYGDSVVLMYEYAPEEEFYIPLTSFISLLEQWKPVYAQQPPKILITQDGDDYRVYAIHKDEEIKQILGETWH
jgi:hypothetical protein